jgi:hypothetical protein
VSPGSGEVFISCPDTCQVAISSPDSCEVFISCPDTCQVAIISPNTSEVAISSPDSCELFNRVRTPVRWPSAVLAAVWWVASSRPDSQS